MVPGRTPSDCSRCATFTVMSAWRATAAAGPLALDHAPEAVDERAAADFRKAYGSWRPLPRFLHREWADVDATVSVGG